jgi:hypothetical protein
MDTKKCVTMKALPENMKKYRMLGKYPTLGEAEATMHTTPVRLRPRDNAGPFC